MTAKPSPRKAPAQRRSAASRRRSPPASWVRSPDRRSKPRPTPPGARGRLLPGGGRKSRSFRGLPALEHRGTSPYVAGMSSDASFPSLSLVLLAATLITAPLAGGCTTDDSSSPDAGDPAISAKKASDAFWTTYWNNDYAHIPDAQSALEAAIAQNPNDAELTALLAAIHWWHVSEAATPDQHA